MPLCGPKLSLLGCVLSAWGVAQLALMGVFLLDEQRGAGGGHPARGKVRLQGRPGQRHGSGIPAERPKLLGGRAAVPRYPALLCLAVLPEQQADLQRMNRPLARPNDVFHSVHFMAGIIGYDESSKMHVNTYVEMAENQSDMRFATSVIKKTPSLFILRLRSVIVAFIASNYSIKSIASENDVIVTDVDRKDKGIAHSDYLN